MMTVSAVLALLGVILIAAAAFAPRPPSFRPAVSFSPSRVPRPVARWAKPVGWYPPRFPPAEPTDDAAGPPQPTWPALVDPRAAACDADVRLALIEALALLRTPWASTILRLAIVEETDARVRDAALRGVAPADC